MGLEGRRGGWGIGKRGERVRAQGRQGLQLADVAQFGRCLIDVASLLAAKLIDPDAQDLTVAVVVYASKMQGDDVVDLEAMRKIDKSTTACAIWGLRPKTQASGRQSTARYKASRPRRRLAYCRHGLPDTVTYAAQH